MSFFKQFPKIDYDLDDQNDLRSITDLFRHVDVNEISIDPLLSYTEYEVSEGDRPDNVSQLLYGSTDYYWTFFIVNDFLKDGLSAWPKSGQELERYITQEHDKNSVLTFAPRVQSITQNGTTYTSLINTLNGLDMTHPYLRLRRQGSLYSHTYARVSHYDASMYQLFVYGVNDSDKFFSSDGTYYVETFNPYRNGESEYITTEALNNEWREKLFSYHEKENVYGHALITNQLSLTAGISSLSRVDYLKSYESIAQWLYMSTLNTTRTNLIGRNAPKEYLSADGSEIITGYDALVAAAPVLDSNGDEIPYPYLNTYAEDEREKNLNRRMIKVVKKSIINEFVDAYKDLIQS